jgi:hypothetical protein
MKLDLTSLGRHRALEYRFELLVGGPQGGEIAGAVQAAYEGLKDDTDAPPGDRYALEAFDADGRLLVQTALNGVATRTPLLLHDALRMLTSDLNDRAVASRPEHLVVHAGAVMWPGDGALLLPGTSGSSKSTLTAALVHAGFGYLSDEAVAIDLATAEVEPYAKPLALSSRSLEALGLPTVAGELSATLAASALRPHPWGGPAVARMLVFPKYIHSARPGLEPLSRGQALVSLAEHSFNFADHGGAWLPGLAAIVSRCSCWRLTHGDAGSAARLLVELYGPKKDSPLPAPA